MNDENTFSEDLEDLYRLAVSIARRGEPYVGGNKFIGKFGGERYYIDHNFWYYDDTHVSIYNSNLGFSIREEIDDQNGQKRYSVRIWRGQIPKNIREILEGLEPEIERRYRRYY